MKLGIILIIFGLLFVFSPFFNMIEYEHFSEISVFIIVGIFFIIGGIYSLYKNYRLNKISKYGKIGRGVYITSDSNSAPNEEPTYFIKFYYKNEYGKEREQKTKSKYTEDEAKYFSLLKDFEIKYDNKYAVITEKIDRRKLLEMKNGKYDSFYTSEQEIKESQILKIKEDDDYFVCSYCNNVQTKAGKCERCGAIIRKTQIDN